MSSQNTKWIVITGGVLSGLGKGIVSASVGRLFSDKKVIPVKCDGYLNMDPGTMNPVEHGEVFVLDDGGEVDQDFGHYERFLNIDCKFDWNLTSGKVFQAVIEKERRGDYLGKTVQMIPHVTDEIKERWFNIEEAENADIMIIEIGGTVGDIENQLFLEAARQLKADVGKKNLLYVHLTYVPVLQSVGEQKTKPTQTSTKELQKAGIFPDVIVCRSKNQLCEKSKAKIASFCNVEKENVISDPNLDSVYELPLIFEREGIPHILKEELGVEVQPLVEWQKLVDNIKKPEQQINIAICGKYTELHDSYISIMEALIHVSAHTKIKSNIQWIETTFVNDDDIPKFLEDVDAIIVPGGFGGRGTEGKIKLIKYARENNIPFLGLCYGLQLAVIEFARNKCNMEGAGSTEVNPSTDYPVIKIMDHQKEIKDKGGTMRLGSYPAVLEDNSFVSSLYNNTQVAERHRHRYEVNPEYHDILRENGLILSGCSPNKLLVEFIEFPNHPFFVATQAHPELKSRLESPAPLFLGLVKAAAKKKETFINKFQTV